MSGNRFISRLTIRRSAIALAVLVAVLVLYVSSYFGAMWLYGATVIDDQQLMFLHRTVYFPLVWFIGEEPVEWFDNLAFEAYMMGYKATR